MTYTRFRSTRIVLLMLAALALAACAPREAARPPEPPPSMDAIRSLVQTGQYEPAADAYLERARQADAPRKQLEQLEAASLLLQARDYQRLAELIGRIDPDPLPPSGTFRLQVLQGELALYQGEPRRVLSLVETINEELPARLRLRGHDLRARAHEALANPIQAVRERIALAPLLPVSDERKTNREQIWAQLRQLSADELNLLSDTAQPDAVRGWAELAAILRSARAEPSRLRARIQQWRGDFPEHPAGQEFLQQRLSQLRQFQQRPAAIALLLPMDGRLSGPAKAIRDGFLAAHYHRSAQQRTETIRIYDTTRYRNRIVDLYNRAVDDGAELVVGPLSKENVATLAHLNEPPVPILALNHADIPLTGVARNFYQFGLSPEDEARQIAERTSLERLERAVAITPKGEWGERLYQAFAARFEQLGGRILEHARYDLSNSDFSAPIQSLLNIDESKNRYRILRNVTGKKIEFEPRRRQDVDFVFMAAFPRQARLIAPQLRFHHAADLPVYTTSHSYSGTPKPADDRDMNGVIFCDTPWTLNTATMQSTLRDPVARFFPDEMQSYTRLLALGVDAYDLAPYLDWLRQQRYERFAGQTGSLYIGPDNRIHRTLQWARFVGGHARVLRREHQPMVTSTSESQN